VPFNSGFIATLLERIEADRSPEDLIPKEIIFSESELDAIHKEILAVELPTPVLDRLGFFLGQLDFCRRASPRFESMSKDTLKLAGKTVGSVCNEQCPLDKRAHLCTQTENGASVRAYQTSIHFAKALAYFRGNRAVEVEDLRQIVPWVLHEKLVPNERSPFFEGEHERLLLQDRVAWIRSMIDTALEQYEKHRHVREQVVAARQLLDQGLEGVDRQTVKKRIASVVKLMDERIKNSELSGPVYEDLIHLKSLHSRYQNYARWLEGAGT
jgi:hypothetical protein